MNLKPKGIGVTIRNGLIPTAEGINRHLHQYALNGTMLFDPNRQTLESASFIKTRVLKGIDLVPGFQVSSRVLMLRNRQDLHRHDLMDHATSCQMIRA